MTREDAKVFMRKEWRECMKGSFAESAFEIAIEALEQPERKKGKWIEQDDSWDGVYYECSACGEPWTTIDGTPWDNGMKFCPNCGARMEDER